MDALVLFSRKQIRAPNLAGPRTLPMSLATPRASSPYHALILSKLTILGSLIYIALTGNSETDSGTLVFARCLAEFRLTELLLGQRTEDPTNLLQGQGLQETLVFPQSRYMKLEY